MQISGKMKEDMLMKKCQVCGSVWSDEIRYCGKCGTDISKKTRKKHKKEKVLVSVMVVAVIAVTSVWNLNRSNNGRVYIWLRDGRYEIFTENKKSAVKVPNSDNASDFLQFSPDDKYIYYLTKYDSSVGTGNLYRCEYKKLGKNDERNEKYSKLIDTNVRPGFFLASEENVVYLDGKADLYLYDGKETQRIEKSINKFYHTEDGNRIAYETGTYDAGLTLYGVNLNEIDNHIQLAESYNTVYDITDFDEIFYGEYDNDREEWEVYVTGFDKSEEKLGTMVKDMYTPYKGDVYCTETVDMDVYELVNAMIMDSRGDTEELETLKGDLIEILEYDAGEFKSLYTYKNGKKELLNECTVGATNIGNVILYMDMKNIKKVDISQYNFEEMDIDDITDDILENSMSICAISKENGKLINITGSAMKMIYGIDFSKYPQMYVTNTDMVISCENKVMAATIKNGRVIQFETITDCGTIRGANETEAYYIEDEYIRNDFTYCDIYSYVNGISQCIARDVIYNLSYMYEDKNILTYTDYEENRGYELILIDENGEKEQIGKEIVDCIRCDKSVILYRTNKDLYLYENGESKKLAVGVDNMWSNKEMQKTDDIGLKYEC